MSQNSIWEKLKDFSTIAAGAGVSLYVLGYIIHVVHFFHVLGIEMPLQPLEYIKTGGDFCASVLISIPQLFSHAGDYFSILFRGKLMLLTTVSTILFYIGLLVLFIRSRMTAGAYQRRWPYWLLGILLLIGTLLLLWQEQKLLTVKQVLQLSNLEKVKEANENIAGNRKEPLNARLTRIDVIYSDYLDSGGDKTEAFDRWKDWYNPKTDRSPKQSRLSLYLALLFLNIWVLAGVWLFNRVLRCMMQPYWHKYLSYSSILVSLILLIFFSSFAYAVIGKSYDYAVVVLRLTPEGDDKPSAAVAEKKEDATDETKAERQMHPVYLIAQTDSQIIVYDRLDFFKVKYIPRDRVRGVNQLFVASPFENCAPKPGDFKPCETSASRDDLWVEDF